MEKAPITSHKSHVSGGGRRRAARPTHAVCGWQAMAPARLGDETWRAEGEGDGGNDAAADLATHRQPAEAALARVVTAIRQGSVATCMVSTSARHQTGAGPVRRTTGTEFVSGTGKAGSCPPGAECPRRIGEPHATAYRTPWPVRGNSQGAYFAIDRTES
jgi:hypothetical protein